MTHFSSNSSVSLSPAALQSSVHVGGSRASPGQNTLPPAGVTHVLRYRNPLLTHHAQSLSAMMALQVDSQLELLQTLSQEFRQARVSRGHVLYHMDAADCIASVYLN